MMFIQCMIGHIHELLLFIEQAHESFKWLCIYFCDSKYNGIHCTIYGGASWQGQTCSLRK